MKPHIKPRESYRRLILKSIASLLVKFLGGPQSYRYQAMLFGFLRELNEKLVIRSIGLFADNSREQFVSGAVYKYKDVVRYENETLKINTGLAKERIDDIFLNADVLNYLQISGNESLLEVGCEAGQNLSVIRESMPEMQLHGCDISSTALSSAEKAGVSVRQIDLLEPDSLSAYGDDQFDYVLVSHVLEHLVKKDLQYSKEIRYNVLQHIHRISKAGYVITTALISAEPEPIILSFLGHSRVALTAFPTGGLSELGVSSFLVKINKHDDSLSLIVKKMRP